MPDPTVLIGLLWLAATLVLSAHGVEPVATFSFLFAWAGLIYTFDRLIAGVEGRSLIARLGPGRFAVVLAASAVNWFAYELANLRLDNWYYVLVTDDDLLRVVGTVVAFATVFPGIFWIDHWLAARGILAEPGGPTRVAARELSTRALTAIQVLGVACLVLCLADPTHFFPLIWGATAFLVAPWNHRLGLDGWLRQWQQRRLAPTGRMLLAGAIAGLCWELFNVFARARWIYTVPYLDELKLFEMPLLGFLGFPPFALECACVYRLLVHYRLAPAFGAFHEVGPPRGPALRIAAVVLGLAIGTAGYRVVDRVTITSRTPRVADVAALDDAQRPALADAGVTHLTQLVGWGSEAVWHRVEAALAGDAAVHDLRRTTALYLHRGIGTTYGNRLVAAGVNDLDDLRGRDVDAVWQRLRDTDAPGPVPSRAQVKVWIRGLR